MTEPAGAEIWRHGVVLGLAILAVALPVATGSGGSGSPQTADTAWMDPIVWSPEARELAFSAAFCTNRACGDYSGDASAVAAPTPTPVPQARAASTTSTPVPTPEPEPWATMVVRPGDTLLDLAIWFGIKPGDIAAVNGIGIGDFLVIGETLVIPVPQSQFVHPPEPALVLADDVLEGAEGATFAEPLPEPVVIETPSPTPPPFSGTADEVIAAICSLPWPCDQMVGVAMCESGLVPSAHNPAGYYGLFQINFSFEGWDDPFINSQVAYEQKYLPALAAGDGLSAWPHCASY